MSITTTRREDGTRKKFWRLVWNEEFDQPGIPDPARWTPETGFCRNKEPQFYRRENARVENSCLVLEARRESEPNPGYDPAAPDEDWKHARKTIEYTSASLTTRLSASWRFGRVEVRAKIPFGQGSWPAIWMLGTNCSRIGWPRCGEIDIMEHWCGKNSFSTEDNVYATVHFSDDTAPRGFRSFGGHHPAGKPWDDFHLYELEWDTDKMVFSYDGIPYHTFQVEEAGAGETNPFRQPQYLLLNLALNPNYPPDPDTVMPFRFLIDYVRVYERID